MKRSNSWSVIGKSGILLLSCLAATAATAEKTSPVPCQVTGRKPSPQDAIAAKAIQQNIKTSPLYAIPAAAKGLFSCSIRYPSKGAIEIDYRFREGGWLNVKRDAQIEYTEQNANFILPESESAETILAQAERAAFGTEGCGIDWLRPETRSAQDISSITETIFRGDTCNCQALIRRRADGVVIGLMLRSAC